MFGTTNTGFPGSTQFTNVSVTFSLQSTPDYADYPYRATYSNSAITSNTFASVIYSGSQTSTGKYASFCSTFDGGVYLYATSDVGTITIPTISIGMYSSGLNIDETVTPDSKALITSGAVSTAITNSRKIPFCKIGRTTDSVAFAVNTLLAVDFGNYADNLDSSVFSVSQAGGITRITVLKSGWFMINCTEYIQRSQAGRAQVSITVSGTQEYVFALNYLNSGDNNSVTLQHLCHLSAGDWVAPELWGDGSGTIRLQPGNGRENHLTLYCMSLD